jgi:hypothetical protein
MHSPSEVVKKIMKEYGMKISFNFISFTDYLILDIDKDGTLSLDEFITKSINDDSLKSYLSIH